MKKNLMLIIKGFFIGIANVIPGVSGGTLAITLGIYNKLINCISHFFKDFKKNVLFLLPLGIGAILAIILGSKLLSFSLENYRLATILFFTGLIFGGIPILFNKVNKELKSVSNWIVFIVIFAIITILAFLNPVNNIISLDNINMMGYLKLVGVGMIAAGTMIIPGISGSFVLMLMGYYEPILHTLKNITDFNLLGTNLSILIPFGVGILIGAIILAKIVEWLFRKYEVKTYSAVLGFVLSSTVAIYIPLWGRNSSVAEWIVGIILAIGGFIMSYKIGEK